MSTKLYWASVTVLNVGPFEAILYFGTLMDFCPYLPHVLSDLGEILLERCARNAVGVSVHFVPLRRVNTPIQVPGSACSTCAPCSIGSLIAAARCRNMKELVS